MNNILLQYSKLTIIYLYTKLLFYKFCCSQIWRMKISTINIKLKMNIKV